MCYILPQKRVLESHEQRHEQVGNNKFCCCHNLNNGFPIDKPDSHREYNQVDGLMDTLVPTEDTPKYRDNGVASQEHPLHFLLDEDVNGKPTSQADGINKLFTSGKMDQQRQNIEDRSQGMHVDRCVRVCCTQCSWDCCAAAVVSPSTYARPPLHTTPRCIRFLSAASTHGPPLSAHGPCLHTFAKGCSCGCACACVEGPLAAASVRRPSLLPPNTSPLCCLHTQPLFAVSWLDRALGAQYCTQVF